MKNFRVVIVLTLLAVSCLPSAFAGDAAEFSQWSFKPSIEERFRYEFKKDFDFDDNKKDKGSLFSHRLRVGGLASLTDEYLKPKLDIFLEGLDAQDFGNPIKAPANQVDDFDIHQAYINAYNIFGSDFDIKLGREEFKYGKGRLIAASTWANRIRSFDGGVLHYHKGGLWTDLLYGQDVKNKDGQLNKSVFEEFLTGIYGGYQKHKMAPLIETYFLMMNDTKASSNIQRYTTGARLQTTLGAGNVLDIEVPFQFGRTGSSIIRAYAYHADITKSCESLPWKPKLMIGYDEASGDKKFGDGVSNTFVPLYQTTHEPYGLLDFFRWQNVRNPEVNATFSPTDKFKFTPQADFFLAPEYCGFLVQLLRHSCADQNHWPSWTLCGDRAFTACLLRNQ